MPMKYTSGHFPLSKSLYGSPVPSNKVLQNLVSADLDNLPSQCTPHPSSHAGQLHWRRGHSVSTRVSPEVSLFLNQLRAAGWVCLASDQNLPQAVSSSLRAKCKWQILKLRAAKMTYQVKGALLSVANAAWPCLQWFPGFLSCLIARALSRSTLLFF